MIRRIITIDEEKCNGCGLCADACPMNAISFEEREAPAYNEAAVLAAKKAKEAPLPCGCPGSACFRISQCAELPGGEV